MKTKLIILLLLPVLLGCSSGNLKSNSGKCHSLQNTSNSIRSFTVLHEYKSKSSVSDIITLKPGEEVLLSCRGSVKSKIAGSVKVAPSNYKQHKCMDSLPYRRRLPCD